MIQAAQEATVPRSRGFDQARVDRSLELVYGALAQKPKVTRLKLCAFLVLIDLASRVRCGRSFVRLGIPGREQLLRSFFDSRFPVIRKGFWGLNTLTRLGVYGQESVYSEIGYRQKELPR